MPKTSKLSKAPPFAVEDSLIKLGRNLRTARLRRNMTIAEAAEKIGAGVRAVSDAEHGKATTAISVYVALLWAYDLLADFGEVGDPLQDEEGLR
ncbi:MAG: helix-turn-helix transcriptional regulator, partial [Clostridiales Family XIII bacterium]|nr:helix-turn-helix transcriptional regulator [Clostridiales Family XIII bacterium]